MTNKQYAARYSKFANRARKYKREEENRTFIDTLKDIVLLVCWGWLFGKIFTSGWGK